MYGSRMTDEFRFYADPILFSDEYLKRLNFKHHGNYSVYEHCLEVALNAYEKAKAKGIEVKDIIVAGLLHDFYENDFHLIIDRFSSKKGLENQIDKILQMHMFTHAKEAAENARRFFPDMVNDNVYNIIKSHMVPFNMSEINNILSSDEARIVWAADKTKPKGITKEILGVSSKDIYEEPFIDSIDPNGIHHVQQRKK